MNVAITRMLFENLVCSPTAWAEKKINLIRRNI